jgi:collagenase-like PrtC family protease
MADGRGITFEVATNFDPEIVAELARCDSVTWVYGKLNADVIGGGRASFVLPRVSWSELEAHVALCHRHGIKFNYLLNSLCLGNQEFEKPFHRRLLRLLDRLAGCAVDGLTVASPYLCELVKRQYPRFEVSISDYNRITSPQQMKYWLELGADEITLFQSVNRDFARLRQLLVAARGTAARLRLIANNTCLRECPFHENHANAAAHSSQSGHRSRKFLVDYPLLKCTNAKLHHPVQYLAAGWIRPEDVVHYEQVCAETGSPNLTLKLTDRSKTTAFLARAARAYHERRYDGNLFDLLNLATNKDRRQVHLASFRRRALFGRYNIGAFQTMSAIGTLPELSLDNRQLDGFVDRFVSGFDCTGRVCDDGGAAETSPAAGGPRCGYCRTWAEKALRVDEPARQAWLAGSDAVLEDVRTSRMLRFARPR